MDYRIPDLPALPGGTTLTTLVEAVYDPATDKTYRRAAALTSAALAANAVRGAVKIVRFLGSTLFGVPLGASTLDRLDTATLCVGNEAVVLNPALAPGLNTAPPKRYILVRQPDNYNGGLLVALDANPDTTATAKCIWLAVDDPNAVGAAIPYLDRTKFLAQDSTVKYDLGTLRLFVALVDMDPEEFPGTGPLGEDWIPAPTGDSSDPYYREVSPDALVTDPPKILTDVATAFNAVDYMGGTGERFITHKLYVVEDAVGGPVTLWSIGPHEYWPIAVQNGSLGYYAPASGTFTPGLLIADVQGLQAALDSKLDASAYSDRYKGKFTSLSALSTAHPTSADGDYAIVDPGAGTEAKNAIWDAQEGWVLGSSTGGGPSTTDGLPEGSANLYHTAARVRAVLLTGLSTAVNAVITATDDILTAFGKLQAQVSANTTALTSKLGTSNLSNATPQAHSNTPSAGTSSNVSRADHVHPIPLLPQAQSVSFTSVSLPSDGSTTEQVLEMVTFPAFTFSAGSSYDFFSQWQFTGSTGIKYCRVRASNSPTFTGGEALLGIIQTTGTTQVTGKIPLVGVYTGTQFLQHNNTHLSGGTSNAAVQTSTLDRTLPIYIFFTAERANGADTVTKRYHILKLTS